MKKSILTFVFFATLVMVVFKIFIACNGFFNVYDMWIESSLIHIGVGILFGGCADYVVNRKVRAHYKYPALCVTLAVTAVVGYFMQVYWMYIVNVSYPFDSDIMELFDFIFDSDFPGLYSIITTFAAIITYLVIQKAPRYINSDIDDNVILRKDIDFDGVKCKEIGFDSELVKNLISLYKYEYRHQGEDLSMWSCTDNLENIDVNKDKFYMVEYNDKPVGYFIVRPKDGNCYDITQFYAPLTNDHAFLYLFTAFGDFLSTLRKAKITFLDVGTLPTNISNATEYAIKEITFANYALIATESPNDDINYNIYFEI